MKCKVCGRKESYEARRAFLLYKQKGFSSFSLEYSFQQICPRFLSTMDQVLAFGSLQLVRPKARLVEMFLSVG